MPIIMNFSHNSNFQTFKALSKLSGRPTLNELTKKKGFQNFQFMMFAPETNSPHLNSCYHIVNLNAVQKDHLTSLQAKNFFVSTSHIFDYINELEINSTFDSLNQLKTKSKINFLNALKSWLNKENIFKQIKSRSLNPILKTQSLVLSKHFIKKVYFSLKGNNKLDKVIIELTK